MSCLFISTLRQQSDGRPVFRQGEHTHSRLLPFYRSLKNEIKTQTERFTSVLGRCSSGTWAIVGTSARQVSGSTKMKNSGTQRVPARSECSRSIISLTNSFVWISSGAFKSFISVLHPKLQLMAVLAHGSVFSPVGGAASGVLQASQHNTS